MVGSTPDPSQAAAIAWRARLATVVSELQQAHPGWSDEELAESYPLVEFDTGKLNGRSSRWTLDALKAQIENLKRRMRTVSLDAEAGETAETPYADRRQTPPEPSAASEAEAVEADPTLITVAEAAEITQLKKWRIYELCRKDEFPGQVRFGRQIRIRRSQLIEFIKNGGFRLAGGWRRDPS